MPESHDSGQVPSSEGAPGTREHNRQLAQLRRSLARAERRIEAGERHVAQLQAALSAAYAGRDPAMDPTRMVWIFGSGRTGSTWLSEMMGDLPGHHLWNEPLFGKLFGDLYYSVREERRREPSFILGDPPEARQASIRSFVLHVTALRYPGLAEDGHLILKEPGGSIGAPVLMEALPESRMIFLIRDLRDSVASYMDGVKPGGRIYNKRGERGKAALESDPEQLDFLKNRVRLVANEVAGAKAAYEAHRGPKAFLRYEDLRADTLGEMERLYSTLGIPADEEALKYVVEKHSWENVPEHKKGPGKHRRKAQPGAWREDLTQRQLKIVDHTLSPLIREFYPS